MAMGQKDDEDKFESLHDSCEEFYTAEDFHTASSTLRDLQSTPLEEDFVSAPMPASIETAGFLRPSASTGYAHRDEFRAKARSAPCQSSDSGGLERVAKLQRALSDKLMSMKWEDYQPVVGKKKVKSKGLLSPRLLLEGPRKARSVNSHLGLRDSGIMSATACSSTLGARESPGGQVTHSASGCQQYSAAKACNDSSNSWDSDDSCKPVINYRSEGVEARSDASNRADDLRRKYEAELAENKLQEMAKLLASQESQRFVAL